MFFNKIFKILIYLKKIILLAKTPEISQYSPIFYLEHFEESISTNLIVDMTYFPSTIEY